MSVNRFFAGKTRLQTHLVVGLLLIVSLLLVYIIRQASQRHLRTGMARPSLSQSNIVRNDLVAGKKGKKYRRVVRVDRNAADKTVTTTVTFTETKTGGVGVATYIEPEITGVQSFFASNQRLDAFVLINGGRVGLNGPPRGRKYPLMCIPQPMEPGQKWKVRLLRTARGGYSEASGKAPRGATLVSASFRAFLGRNPPARDTCYGQGVVR